MKSFKSVGYNPFKTLLNHLPQWQFITASLEEFTFQKSLHSGSRGHWKGSVYWEESVRVCWRAAESCLWRWPTLMTSLMTHQHKEAKQRTFIPHTHSVILISLAQHTHTHSLTNPPHKCVSFWQQIRPACVSVYNSLLSFYSFYTASKVNTRNQPILAFTRSYAIYQSIYINTGR